MEYSWNDNDLIDAYDIAINLGIKSTSSEGKVKDLIAVNPVHDQPTCNVTNDDPYASGDYSEYAGAESYYDDNEYTDGYSDTANMKSENAEIGYQIYNSYYDDSSRTIYTELEENTSPEFAQDLHGEFVNDTSVVVKTSKGKNKTKQVRFNRESVSVNETVTLDGNRQTGWDKQSAYLEGDAVHSPGTYYTPNPVQTPDWTAAFPKLTAPPMPESLVGGQNFKKGDISSLLMSWYMCGYHSGYYDATQDSKRMEVKKRNNN